MNSTLSTDVRSERSLTNITALFLTEEGYRVRAEVPNLGQSVDLVATKGRWVTFIEVKVKDWRKAIDQCRAHVLVADYICIALGTKKISEAAVAVSAKHNIGLIHINHDGECEWFLKPKKNQAVWLPQRRQLAQELKAIEYAY